MNTNDDVKELLDLLENDLALLNQWLELTEREIELEDVERQVRETVGLAAELIVEGDPQAAEHLLITRLGCSDSEE